MPPVATKGGELHTEGLGASPLGLSWSLQELRLRRGLKLSGVSNNPNWQPWVLLYEVHSFTRYRGVKWLICSVLKGRNALASRGEVEKSLTPCLTNSGD